MRADARSLLDRLGRSDFAYKEFADRFSDLELWPLFEALVKDPRLFLQDTSIASAAAVERQPQAPAPRVAHPQVAHPQVAMPLASRPAEPARPAPRAPAPSGAESLAELFNRYEGGAEAAPQPRQPQDVRAMLRRLSDLDDRGEL
jgi:hypothetical protein